MTPQVLEAGPSGKIYLAGSVGGELTFGDVVTGSGAEASYFIAAIGVDGSVQWFRRFQKQVIANGGAFLDLSVRGDGRVEALGSVEGGPARIYEEAGAELRADALSFVATFHPSGSVERVFDVGLGLATRIAATEHGLFAIASSTLDGGCTDGGVSRFDADGTPVWDRCTDRVVLADLGVSPGGHVVAGGRGQSPSRFSDGGIDLGAGLVAGEGRVFLASWSEDGSPLDVRFVDEPARPYQFAMDVSPAGEIGLGVCNSRLDEPHLASLMTADGETRWQHLSTDTPVCQYGEAILVGVDPVGNSVWADASHGGADEPWLLSKLDRNGAVVWQRALDELGGPDVPGGYALLDMDDDGNTYMFVMASYDLGFGGVGYFAKIGP